MTASTEIQDVFTAYGETAHRIQLMEFDLVSIWMIDSVTQGVSVTKQDLLTFQAGWGRKTFGQLLKPIQKSDLILTEIKGFLEQVRVTRNQIVHSFFLDYGKDLLTCEGRHKALCELQHMEQLIQKGQELFHVVLETYLKDFDVDVQAIRMRILSDANSKD